MAREKSCEVQVGTHVCLAFACLNHVSFRNPFRFINYAHSIVINSHVKFDLCEQTLSERASEQKNSGSSEEGSSL